MKDCPGKIQTADESQKSEKVKTSFDLFVKKTRSNIKDYADNPVTTWSNDAAGRFENYAEKFFEIGNWTSSFFTGMALLAWRETEDEFFLDQVLRLAPLYREKVFNHHLDTHHDLGFLYSLYSVALYKLTGEKEHREVALRAAEVLSQRFNPKGNFIRAWGHMNTNEQDNMAIIDCLMNLPLLHWATNESGDKKFRDIAIRHADMALKCFIRPDGSVNHAYRFDLKTGQPLGADNYCGFSKDSYWARGTTWATYGFALSYRYTSDARYLKASVDLAKSFIARLDDEVVPFWDFHLSPADNPERDASAAAIMVCGLQELEKHQAAETAMLQIKSALLAKICTDDYLNSDADCRGVLKKCQIGNVPGKMGYSYTSWGDYFLMEALGRELNTAETFW